MTPSRPAAASLYAGAVLASGTVFFSEPVPEAGMPPPQRAAARAAWSARAYQAVAGCDLVFLDPDNGLQVSSVGPASRLAGKYANAAEVAWLLERGDGVVLYQHRDRSPWPVQLARITTRLNRAFTGDLTARTLRFGGRAFLCLSADSERAAVFDAALDELADRVAAWSRAHHLVIGR